MEIELLTGLSFIEPIIELIGVDPVHGFKIVDGIEFKMNDIDINLDCIVTQVYNNKVASDIKLILSQVYGGMNMKYI